jgi:hypothetical protein
MLINVKLAWCFAITNTGRVEQTSPPVTATAMSQLPEDLSIPDPKMKVAQEFRHQGTACGAMGSALYAELCERIADDVTNGGICWEALESHAHLRFGLALPLRFLGGVHQLGHLGRAPELARHYPSLGATDRDSGDDLWAAFCAVVSREGEALARSLDRGVQTNEVVRSSALIEGLRAIEGLLGLPLALREVGTSGGLNLRMDQFAYVDGDRVGGDSLSALRIVDRWRGPTRPTLAPVRIVDRAGCDPAPIDPLTPEGRATLLSFLWPDQTDRAQRLNAAIDIAARLPARIEAAHADEWVLLELAKRANGTATVIFHSIVWQYIDKDERDRIAKTIEASGAEATPESPIAWLSFEPSESRDSAALDLRLWDGGLHTGERRCLALCGFHGEWVELLETM